MRVECYHMKFSGGAKLKESKLNFDPESATGKVHNKLEILQLSSRVKRAGGSEDEF